MNIDVLWYILIGICEHLYYTLCVLKPFPIHHIHTYIETWCPYIRAYTWFFGVFLYILQTLSFIAKMKEKNKFHCFYG